MTQRSTLRASAVLVLCLGFSASVVAQDPKALVQEAYDLVARGKNAEALEKLNAVLAGDPSSEAAYDLRASLEAKQWIEISVANDKLGEVVTQLFGRAMPAAAAKTADAAAIDKLLEEARSSEWLVREKALRSLLLNHGEYAVARLWKDLANSETERRVQAMDWMRRMGSDASLPLIQCLKSTEVMVRTNAATVLGMIGDHRAKPYLAHAAANEAEAVAKEAAAAALAKLGGADAPIEEAVKLGKMYYARDPRAVNNYRIVYPVWSLDRDGENLALNAYEVPRDLYHLKLAEGLLFDALRWAPDHEAARTLLVSVLLAEGEFGRGVAAEGEGTAVAAACAQARVLAAAQGPAVLSNVVKTAAAEGRADVAAAALALLGTVADADTADAASGLADGLASTNKNVRYAAALAAVKSQARNLDAAKVVDALAQAVGEDATRNVVVIDDVTDTREALCAQLEAKNWFCSWTDAGATGVVRLRDYPIEDLVIVRYDLSNGHVSDVVSSIRRDDRTKDVPVVILASAKDMEAAKKDWDGKVQGFIAAPPVSDAYEPALKELVKSLDGAREAATVTAAKAASALAAMDPKGTYPVAAAKGALIASLKGDDRVRTPAIIALGKLADASAEGALLEVFRDATATETVRGEAAKALARISRAAGKVNPEFGAALREAGMAGGSPEYVMMLGEATGLLPLAPQTRLGAMRMGRAKAMIDLSK
jgi:HEAT repeat protein